MRLNLLMSLGTDPVKNKNKTAFLSLSRYLWKTQGTQTSLCHLAPCYLCCDHGQTNTSATCKRMINGKAKVSPTKLCIFAGGMHKPHEQNETISPCWSTEKPYQESYGYNGEKGSSSISCRKRHRSAPSDIRPSHLRCVQTKVNSMLFFRPLFL